MIEKARLGTGTAKRRMTAPRWSNRPVSWLLRSPFHWIVSGRLMLIALRGRRTGRFHSLPVGYVQRPGVIYILVAEYVTKQWWRNVEGATPVALIVRRHVLDARATMISRQTDRQEFDSAFALYLTRFPRLRAKPDEVLIVRCALA